MSVFTRKDPRLLACADPTWPSALYAMVRRHVAVAGALLLLMALSYTANVAAGFRSSAITRGTVNGLDVTSAVAIVRDARGIPHVRARNAHDLFFGEGFAQASDRLFEMDLTRRYAYGRLAEVFGAKALALDEEMRAVDVQGIASRQWRGTDAATREALDAFSAGVNAAQARQPLPVEFRMLLYRPAAWTPQDSIAVSIVAALELGDSWYDVLARDDRWKALGRACYDVQFPLSDTRYDVSLGGRPLRTVASPRRTVDCAANSLAYRPSRLRAGSNAWAAGSVLTRAHRALIANDPHVDLTIPGIWYAIDLRSPGFHAAGAVVPGLPGVVLGHNERIAWAVTNAEVTTSSLYRVRVFPRGAKTLERFGVRFAPAVWKTYYRTADAFSIQAGEDGDVVFVRWAPYMQTKTSIATLLELDRASSIHAAMRALAAYRGAPQNFIVADLSGAVAYHLAGSIPGDPAWGRYVHSARHLPKPFALIPFRALPARAASRSGILISANNRMYGAGYRYRLSAAFEPPYRAYRIAALLHSRKAYDAAYFSRMQMDSCSPIDAEFARDVVRATQPDGEVRRSPLRMGLARWNGCFTPDSRTASFEHSLMNDLLQQNASPAYLLAQIRESNSGARESIDETASAALREPQDEPSPWGEGGRVDVEHPLSQTWYGLLRGISLPGDGDEYSIHLQEPGFAQGFRAVWDVGNWDGGGIVLPSGESGEPGSGHYDDLASAWIRGAMVPLPFSQHAVNRAAADTLTLTGR